MKIKNLRIRMSQAFGIGAASLHLSMNPAYYYAYAYVNTGYTAYRS